jgi:transcriptional regulator with XRE-family HTH domain
MAEATIGELVRRWRTRRGLSQETLAHLVGRSPRWERMVEDGTADPRLGEIRGLASALGVDVSQLIGDEEPSEEDVKRRQFLHLLGVSGVTAVGGLDPDPWDRLSQALRLGRVDQATVDHLARVTIALDRLQRDVGPATLLTTVNGHLEHVISLLQRPLQPAIRRQLASVAGEVAAMAGWLKWNLDDGPGAAAYFRSGLEAAKEARDRPLGAYLVGCMACQPFYRESPDARLRTLTGTTFGFQAKDATPSTAAWLANLEAGAHALNRDGDRYLQAIQRAESLLSQPDADEETRRPRAGFFDLHYFAEEQAASLLRLEQAEEARTVIEQTLARLDSGRTKMRLWLRTDLAAVYALEDQPEEACRVGLETLADAAELGIQPIVRSLRGLRELEPYGELRAVRDFREAAAALS